MAPNPWTPRFWLLGSNSMDTKTLIAWFQLHGHQDFDLLGSNSMDTKALTIRPGDHTPPHFVTICTLANISITHLGNHTCPETISYSDTFQGCIGIPPMPSTLLD